MTKRLNVRCCCTPTKIYGTLPVPDNVRVGLPIRFLAGQEELILNVEKMASFYQCTEELRENISPSLFSAALGNYTELAFKYEGDDVPAEQKLATLRLIRGFQEAVTI